MNVVYFIHELRKQQHEQAAQKSGAKSNVRSTVSQQFFSPRHTHNTPVKQPLQTQNRPAAQQRKIWSSGFAQPLSAENVHRGTPGLRWLVIHVAHCRSLSTKTCLPSACESLTTPCCVYVPVIAFDRSNCNAMNNAQSPQHRRSDAVFRVKMSAPCINASLHTHGHHKTLVL